MPLKMGHHWPTIECWLRVFRTILQGNLYMCHSSGGGGPDPCPPPLDPPLLSAFPKEGP